MSLGLPRGNSILNSKQRKKLLQALDKQFGLDSLPEGVYVQNTKEKVFLMNRDLDDIDFESLRIDSLGLYLGVWQLEGFRLSIDGAQLLAPMLKKDPVKLSHEQRNLWMKGNDLDWDENDGSYVIVMFESDVLGCGKFRKSRDGKPGVLLNYTPKARRLVVVNE